MKLGDAIERFAGHGSVLVIVDFDGTIAPIVDHPDHAAPASRAAKALVRLAGLDGVAVSILSGRGYRDLEDRAGNLPGVRLIGGHGTETTRSSSPDDLTAVMSRLNEAAERLPGAWVEVKNHSLGLHYRAVRSERLEAELGALRAWAAGRDDLHPLENKRIFEVGLRPLSKGSAVEELRGALGAEAVFYAGDDSTDESVFALLGSSDIGVKVGEGATAAGFRVPGVEEVCDLLDAMVQALITSRSPPM